MKMKFLPWAYVVGGGWELFAFLDNSRSMITLNPTRPPPSPPDLPTPPDLPLPHPTSRGQGQGPHGAHGAHGPHGAHMGPVGPMGPKAHGALTLAPGPGPWALALAGWSGGEGGGRVGKGEGGWGWGGPGGPWGGPGGPWGGPGGPWGALGPGPGPWPWPGPGPGPVALRVVLQGFQGFTRLITSDPFDRLGLGLSEDLWPHAVFFPGCDGLGGLRYPG